MVRNIHTILDDFSEFISLLPEDKRIKALQLQSDDLLEEKENFLTSKHILESLARTLSSLIPLCHFLWL